MGMFETILGVVGFVAAMLVMVGIFICRDR